jgi:hypothetical protein
VESIILDILRVFFNGEKKGFLDGVRSLIFVSDPQKKKKQKELGILCWIPEIHQMSVLPASFCSPFPTAFVFLFPLFHPRDDRLLR